MYYAVLVPPSNRPDGENFDSSGLVFDNIKDASKTLKQYPGSRMKTFDSKDKAQAFLADPDKDGSFIDDSILDDSQNDIVVSLERLSITKKTEPDAEKSLKSEFPSLEPRDLAKLRRTIESGDYDTVEEMIWSNPRYLVTVCDSAVYLMAGPKYNACHIAARSNKPDMMALILDTVSNMTFIKKLYPNEGQQNLQDRLNHLLDSYLNTPDPRQGNTPLHFACKLGHYKVVRVLLTFEDCDINLRDSAGKTAEESVCSNCTDGDASLKQKIKDMFKGQLHTPVHRDQLKKRLLLAKRAKKVGANLDSDTSFSDDSFGVFSPQKKDSQQ